MSSVLGKMLATNAFRGDGEYLESVIPTHKRVLLQRVFPQKIKSYKYDVYPDKYKGTLLFVFTVVRTLFSLCPKP